MTLQRFQRVKVLSFINIHVFWNCVLVVQVLFNTLSVYFLFMVYLTTHSVGEIWRPMIGWILNY
jgi:hypothetical protein